MKEDPTNLQAITYESFKSGSVVTSGSYTPTSSSTSAEAAAASMSAASTASLGGVQVLSTSYVAVGSPSSTE